MKTTGEQSWIEQTGCYARRHHIEAALSVAESAQQLMRAERRQRWVWAGVCLLTACALAWVIVWGS